MLRALDVTADAERDATAKKAGATVKANVADVTADEMLAAAVAVAAVVTATGAAQDLVVHAMAQDAEIILASQEQIRWWSLRIRRTRQTQRMEALLGALVPHAKRVLRVNLELHAHQK